MEAGYRELPPPAVLRRQVACFWLQTVGSEGSVQRVVPDGCADIVVFDGRAPIVAGPALATAMVALPAHSVIVGARFRPGMVQIGLGVSACALRDQAPALDGVWHPREARALSARLADARDPVQRAAELARILLARPMREPDPSVERAVRWIAANPAAHLGASSAAGLGERQLLRRFQEHVGYGPKTLQRVLRFQRLLVLAERAPPHGTLAALAASAGYLDQPHMTREVKALSGLTPSALLRRGHGLPAMSDFFKTLDAGPRTLTG